MTNLETLKASVEEAIKKFTDSSLSYMTDEEEEAVRLFAKWALREPDDKEKPDGKRKTFVVDAHWVFQRSFDVEADTPEEAEEKLQARFERGELVRGLFEPSDDLDTLVYGVKNADESVTPMSELTPCKNEPRAPEPKPAPERNADCEDLAKWFANEVVENANDAHSIETFQANGVHSVKVAFNNTDAETASEADDKLERMNMLEWREACDKVIETLLARADIDPDPVDYPTPRPVVTKQADENDVITTVSVLFTVNYTTMKAIDRALESLAKHERHQTCHHCGKDIKYARKIGRAIIICPHCGRAVALCNECSKFGEECNECRTEKLANAIIASMEKPGVVRK